jgi:hypothetical protein
MLAFAVTQGVVQPGILTIERRSQLHGLFWFREDGLSKPNQRRVESERRLDGIRRCVASLTNPRTNLFTVG